MLKILVAGGFGVGKTTFIRTISEITPITTEEVLTESSTATDDLEGVAAKETTTVAFDFGRLTVGEQLELMLFGTPGQDRFADFWFDLARGAVGIVVLADTRRLDISFPAVTFCERAGLPHIVAVNQWDGAYRYQLNDVRRAFQLRPHVPMTTCDAREKSSVRDTLLRLVDHALDPTPPATALLDAR
ncbi:ATP/GTP-binding protein [Streptomyces sp. NPDC006335]|uniref:GTP-binding protein n=1 Tax=Streptomyces sp. NPDC006335 TaxID=3156895 RepID=UPI0033B79B06